MLALAAVGADSISAENAGRWGCLFNEAHILVTLKRSEEIAAFGLSMGTAFISLAYLLLRKNESNISIDIKAMSIEEATNLVQADANDHQVGGQRTGEAFPSYRTFFSTSEWNMMTGKISWVVF